MKNKLFGIFILVISFASADVLADKGDQYLVGKFGLFTINPDKDYDPDPLYAIGIFYGYGLTPQIAVEAEANFSIAGGGYDSEFESGSYRMWTLGGYGVYRYPLNNAMYIKGKAGLLYEDVYRSSTGDIGQDNHSNGFSLTAGAGIGMLLSSALTMEVEYTQVEQSAGLFSFGFHFAF